MLDCTVFYDMLVVLVALCHLFQINKYLENAKRCDDGLKGDQIGNQQWTFDWHYER